LLCVRAGAGGVDAEDFCETLTAMYAGFAARMGWKVMMINRSDGREGGLRQVTMRVRGFGAYGLLAGEHGSHRVAHHSRFGTRGKRQTSFCSVEVLPWTESPERQLRMSDVAITTYAGSSKGGQRANKVATNVRAVHTPTGLSAVSQGRSLEANRQAALGVLAVRVLAHEQALAEAQRSGQTVNAGFGGRVRSYTFTPYQQVRDERIGLKTSQLQDILAGNLDEIAWRLLDVRLQAQAC
jgi:peptide chain release factor 2